MKAQSICFVSKSFEGMLAFDLLPREIKKLFYETEQNICVLCASDLVYKWTGQNSLKAPPHIWAEVIRQMESGEISDNPFTRPQANPYPGAASDYRSSAEYEREFAYQRFGWGRQDFDPRDDRALITEYTDTIPRLQQADRDRDERALAWSRNVQDLERDRPRSLGDSFGEALDT
jgi:hypothetical protein